MTAEERAVLRSQILRLSKLHHELDHKMPLIEARAGTLAPTYALRELQVVLKDLKQLLEELKQ